MTASAKVLLNIPVPGVVKNGYGEAMLTIPDLLVLSIQSMALAVQHGAGPQHVQHMAKHFGDAECLLHVAENLDCGTVRDLDEAAYHKNVYQRWLYLYNRHKPCCSTDLKNHTAIGKYFP